MESKPLFRPQPYAYLLTETDHKNIVTLQRAGIPRTSATVLIALHKYGPTTKHITSRWIERVADLRQPEVSIAMADFIRDGLVVVTEDKNQTKGRPVKIYRVRKNIHEYVRSQIAVRMAELNKGVMAINEVFLTRAEA